MYCVDNYPGENLEDKLQHFYDLSYLEYRPNGGFVVFDVLKLKNYFKDKVKNVNEINVDETPAEDSSSTDHVDVCGESCDLNLMKDVCINLVKYANENDYYQFSVRDFAYQK